MDRILQSIAAAGFTEAGGFATPLLTTPVPYKFHFAGHPRDCRTRPRRDCSAWRRHGARRNGWRAARVCDRPCFGARLVTEVNLDQKAKAARDSERQRREYLRRFYDIRGEQPLHCDLVLNTEALSTSAAAQLVVSAAKEARKSRASPGGDVE